MFRLFAFWVIVLFVCVSWSVWGLVIHKISPIASGTMAFVAFYSTLFFSFAFTGSLFFSLIWKIFLPTQASYICIKNGLREGFFLSIALSVLVFLFQVASVSWKEVFLLFLLFFLVEMFFLQHIDEKL